MNQLKRFFYFLTLAAVMTIAAADLEIQISATPETVAVGEMISYTITANQPLTRIKALPDLERAQWQTNFISQSRQNINGVESFSYTIPIIPRQEGILKIPAVEVQIKNQTVKTKPVEIKVIPQGEQPALTNSDGSLTLNEALFGRIRLPEKREFYYVGEEIPLSLELFSLPQLRMKLTEYPKIYGLDNVIFHDYSQDNQENRKFAPIRQDQTILQDRRYYKAIFTTAFRATAPGELTPGGDINVRIQLPSQSRQSRQYSPFSDDDFFDFFGMSSRGTTRKVNFGSAPKIEIRALPPAPADALDLGLLGSWEQELKFDQLSGTVGEPLTLRLTLRGTGSTETLTIPKLTWPGFRVYPGEVKKESAGITRQITIQYALIPLEPGLRQKKLKFATFNPAVGEYVTQEFPLEIKITPSERPSQAAVSNNQVYLPKPNLSLPSQESETPYIREELFYQKPNSGKSVKLPLIRNQQIFILFCLIGGPAIWLLLELGHRRGKRAAQDPEYQRHHKLKRQLPQLLKKLQSCPSAELEQLLRDEIVPFLAEAMQLPPSASAGEIAEQLEDVELKQFLLDQEFSSFRPGATTYASPKIIAKVSKLLKKVTTLLLLGAFPLLLHGATGNDFNAAFDRGEFKSAIESYQKELDLSAPSPALLYNIGSCYYQLHNLPLARCYFLQAHLLSPRDTETLENLNLVNRKLALPEIGQVNTPSKMLLWCRDQFRPDQYWAIAAAAFALICLGLGVRHFFTALTVLTYEIISTLVLVLAIVAAITQTYGLYNPKYGIVNGESLELRTLPSQVSGRVESSASGGSDVTIIEQRGDWLRVKVNGRDGWVPVDRVKIIFPGSIF